ncbi:LysM peptidoglycan-binding domain-containing M23 family metallopeptidase [Sinanaerobacter chloroacetimidivorans]|uniref:M23 family metallopeptidase n=1 Tax=Sinanaerobacter chloroacetimidivorans TaxID=2818044 RepID=A0A8J7W056_9FIRM|nr:M23 family metallopeptidase [Sinanaerobacter chloroacetimidivorans]MBR0598334.1 M23 family metallopeptidase [Sinanaerobacter chloroacetimidivorans]
MTKSTNWNKEHLVTIWNDTFEKVKKIAAKKATTVEDGMELRDMGEAHSPISHLNLSGLNREQAKAELAKLIDEKIEKVSQLQMPELKLDLQERERQRAKAAERINERRTRRKERSLHKEEETLITEQGVFGSFKTGSVFDMIQPESFPFEEEEQMQIETITEPLAGQIAMMELKTEEAPTEFIKNENSEVAQTELTIDETIEAVQPEEPCKNEKVVSTTIDSAIDKVFLFFGIIGRKILILYHNIANYLELNLLPKVAILYDKGRSKGKVILAGAKEIAGKWELDKKTKPLFLSLSEKEKAASEKMFRFITFLDAQNDKFLCKTCSVAKAGCYRFDCVRDYAEHNKKKVLMQFGAFVAVSAIAMLVVGNMTAYEYVYNGKTLGVVKNQEDVYKTIDIIGDKLSYEYDAEITIDKEKDITFNKVIAFHQDLDDKEDILNRLTYMKDMKANGHGIYVDGKLVAVLDSVKSAREILDEIKSLYVKKDEGIRYESVGFAENVVVEDIETKLGNIQRKDDVIEYMLTGATEKKIHRVQSGETFSEIAKIYGMKQSELRASNPDVIPEKLQIDQEICLTQAVPVATVKTVEVATYKEAIPFEIAYESTSNLYKGEQTVKSKGVNGEREVVAQIIRSNGLETERVELNSTILSQPASQVVLQGTKDPPPLIGTGTFIYPIRGTLTSRYGTRWGRLHAGIDLAAPTGTKIKAADGGTVIAAGYNGALGYCVKIDHGGGKVTVYGHCSKLFVKTGDKVYQGQHIANVGNTGRSTGPHLHFEVHVNGKTKNPLNYL